jgi:spore germination cell wall hydrolase CwlJ-like protein
MKLAFISTNEYVFVTSEDEAIAYAKDLKRLGHVIENIEIAPLGSSIRKETRVESYSGQVFELDLELLNG